MSIHIHLQHSRGFRWYQRDGWHVKGFLFGSDNEYLHGDALITYLEQAGNPAEWLPNTHGHFAIIYHGEGHTWIAVDKLCAFPVFYRVAGDNIRLADDAQWLANEAGLTGWDKLAAEELRTINCVMGHGTLLQGLQQMQAGEWLRFASGELTVEPYYQHLHNYAHQLATSADYIPLLAHAASGTFQRLVNSLQGRTAVIPLSGGHDSRFIAAMLKQLSYPKVVCYTYGRVDSPEVAISRKVAAQLGYPWYFVEYTPALLDTFMGAEGDAYRAYGAQLHAIAHEQDWFAVGELLKSGSIPADGVVIPGYCGDFPAGSYLPKEAEWQQTSLDLQGLANFIYQRHFQRWGEPSYKDDIMHRLYTELAGYAVSNRDELVSVYEHWLTINRLSRFIVNAIRVYEYYGLEWRMPLWDDAWANTWYSIPNSYRKDRVLYKQYLDSQLFEPLHINYNMSKVDGLFETENFLTKLKSLTPKPLRQGLKKLLIPTNQQDANRLQWLAQRIYGQIADKAVVKEPTAMNHVHACWYLETVQQQLQNIKP